MKLTELKHGSLVTVNTRPDGRIYHLDRLEGSLAHLTYQSHKGLIKTCIHVSYLHQPTLAQLENVSRGEKDE